jgi:hypothetical protein
MAPGNMSTETSEATELHLELRDLKNALSAMRERLELAQAEQEAAVVRGVSDANAESAQLRATVGALRDEL